MLIFYTIKCPYRKHWIHTGNMLPTFIVDDFSNLFYILHLHPTLPLIKDSKSGKIIHGTLSDFQYWLNYNILMSSIFTYFSDEIQVFFMFKMNEDNSNNKNWKQWSFQLIMQTDFLMKDNSSILSLESLKEWSSVHHLSRISKCKLDIYSVFEDIAHQEQLLDYLS